MWHEKFAGSRFLAKTDKGVIINRDELVDSAEALEELLMIDRARIKRDPRAYEGILREIDSGREEMDRILSETRPTVHQILDGMKSEISASTRASGKMELCEADRLIPHSPSRVINLLRGGIVRTSSRTP